MVGLEKFDEIAIGIFPLDSENLLASITLSGCGSSGVLQVSPDTYLISRT